MAIRKLAGTGGDTTSNVSRTTWTEYYVGLTADFTRSEEGWTGTDLPNKGDAHASVANALVEQVKVFPTQSAGQSIAAVTYQVLL